MTLGHLPPCTAFAPCRPVLASRCLAPPCSRCTSTPRASPPLPGPAGTPWSLGWCWRAGSPRRLAQASSRPSASSSTWRRGRRRWCRLMCSALCRASATRWARLQLEGSEARGQGQPAGQAAAQLARRERGAGPKFLGQSIAALLPKFTVPALGPAIAPPPKAVLATSISCPLLHPLPARPAGRLPAAVLCAAVL